VKTKPANKNKIQINDLPVSGEIEAVRAPVTAVVQNNDAGYFADRTEYWEERKLLIQLKDGAIQRFDQILTTLSSSALVFSIFVIKDFVKDATPNSRTLLVLAWVFWFVSLLSVLLSLLFSEKLLAKMIDDADDAYQNKEVSSSRLGWITDKLNYLSLAGFLTGVVLFLVFVALNFQIQK
jgi:hypothetical protein